MALDYGMILNQPSLNQQFQQGIGQYLGIREAEDQAKMREQAQQQADAQAQRQAEFGQAFGQAYQSGNSKDLTALIAQYPEQYQQIKEAAGFQDEQKSKAMGSLGLQLNSLISSGNLQGAAGVIAQNQDVLRNAGPGYEPEGLMKRLAEDPQGLAKQADSFSLLALGPEKYYEVTGNREKLATQQRGQDVQIRGQDIQQQEGAANRINAMNIKQLTLQDKALDRQISAMNTAAANETNDLKRDELRLKIADKQQQLDTTRQELGVQKEKQASVINEALQIAKDLQSNPSLPSAVGTVSTMLPTMSGETQDVINKANTLQAMLTAENLKLMTGVLSETDLALLKSLSSGINITDSGIKGSLKGVKERLKQVQDKLELAQKNAQKTAPAGQPSAATPSAAPDVDALLNKYAPR